MLAIPLFQTPAQTFTVKLTDGFCTISLYWRQERLYLDLIIAEEEGGAGSGPEPSVKESVVCRGAICQNRADIVQSKSRRFTGTLRFFDLEGDSPPRWEGLHTGESGRWALLCLEAGEAMPPRAPFFPPPRRSLSH